MKDIRKHVAVIGAGVTGLSAAAQLAGWGTTVTLIDKAPSAGGHVAQYTCKATDRCVACGACMVVEKLERVRRHPNISMLSQTVIERVELGARHKLFLRSTGTNDSSLLEVDALLAATGFRPFDPTDKPYGYGRLADVLTNLDLERLLRRGNLRRPSDGRVPGSIAFIQCVGSRDAGSGRIWCSQVCCASALRMARLIQARCPDTAITFFYIDAQTFGKSFETFYRQCRGNLEMIRAIPAGILAMPDGSLQVTYFDPQQGSQSDKAFDLAVLSVAMLPGDRQISSMLCLDLSESGFFKDDMAALRGVFTAGSARGPMSISDCIDNAGQVVSRIVRFLGIG